MVLFGFWVANYVDFHGGALCEVASQILAIAEKQQTNTSQVLAHRVIGLSLMCTGDMGMSRSLLN